MQRYNGLWLKMLPERIHSCSTQQDVAEAELKAFLDARRKGKTFSLQLDANMGDSYIIQQDGNAYTLTGGWNGLLYGAYDLIRQLACGETTARIQSSPKYPLRMLNCWDNMDGTIERGYAGESLWFADDRLRYDEERMLYLGRLLASVHINVLCVNNVNVHMPAQKLLTDFLPDLARMADLFRPYGVRLMVSVDFSMPISFGHCATADPLDESVAEFWANTAGKVWQAIPDFAGFLVKADSEHRPGPGTYGRTHAEGANMMAKAVEPYGGVIVWRAFVYDCMQDWRNTETDRPCAAYRLYQPQDGMFRENVILQIKNGPYDFQVREPVSPLLLSMQKTNLALELQLTQEYTGQQIDLYAMPPMWKEIFDVMPPERVCAIAAVSNMGNDEFWTGHPFAALNLYAYGRYAWDPTLEPEKVIDEWVRMTYPELPESERITLKSLLLGSRHAYELYTATLGLCWMVTPHTHYGPNPDGYEFDLWGTYHRADRTAVGIDRTAKGTGYTAQYPDELRDIYENILSCPEELLLFFHRLSYNDIMRDGRSLIQRIYDDHFEGCEAVEKMSEALAGLHLPQPDSDEARKRMDLQRKNAREWRDVVNTFFYRFCGIPDARGRTIYP